MEKLLGFFVAMCVMVACTTPNIKKEVIVAIPDTEEGEGTVIEDTDTGDTDTNTDSTEDSPIKRHATANFCSTEIVFYFEGNNCVNIELFNHNDVAVVVDIYNSTTSGTMVQNCLWPQNDLWGGIDEESVNFSSLDKLELEIWLGQGVSADICSEFVGDLLDSFELCEDITHEISFVFK